MSDSRRTGRLRSHVAALAGFAVSVGLLGAAGASAQPVEP